MDALNTADGVSKRRKTGFENVTGIDTPISVCINCAANAVISTFSKNGFAKLKIEPVRKVSGAENIDTPDAVYK